MVEQLWWNSSGGKTLWWNSNGGTVMVEQKWWNSYGGTVMVEKFGGTEMVEQ